MAESDPSPKCNRVTMTIPEVHSLANRLLARGPTVLTGEPEQQGDLRLAAKALLAPFGSLPLFAAYGTLDPVPSESDPAAAWSSVFANAPAPFGAGALALNVPHACR